MIEESRAREPADPTGLAVGVKGLEPVKCVVYRGGGRDLQDRWERMYRWLAGRDVRLGGAPMVLRFEPPPAAGPWRPAPLPSRAVCQPILDAVQGDPDFTVEVLPGALVAFTLHRGPVERIGPAYARIQRWFSAVSRTPDTPSREIWLGCAYPPHIRSAAELVIEVQVPILAEAPVAQG